MSVNKNKQPRWVYAGIVFGIITALVWFAIGIYLIVDKVMNH